MFFHLSTKPDQKFFSNYFLLTAPLTSYGCLQKLFLHYQSSAAMLQRHMRLPKGGFRKGFRKFENAV